MEAIILTNAKGYNQQVIYYAKDGTPKEPRYAIVGRLKSANRKQWIVGSTRKGMTKNVYKDESNKEFIKANGFWWKFPEQIEH